jgi:hypothetical protein
VTKDEALDLALEALERMKGYGNVFLHRRDERNPHEQVCEAITAIKQARSAPVQSCYCPNCEAMGKELAALKAQPAPVQEPVAWKWHQAPVRTSWGHDMVVADLAIDKDNTVSVYCERDQTAKVEAMLTPPAAQPAPAPGYCKHCKQYSIEEPLPAAQRQWVGLTDDEWDELADKYSMIIFGGLKQEIEAKLKEKNT